MYRNQVIGKNGEDIARTYFRSLGYKIIQSNFRCRQGEIDIIARDMSTNELVFTEVKTRTNKKYGEPIEAVHKKKQKHIVSATKYYTYKNNLLNQFIRFDVVEILLKDKVYLKHTRNCELCEL